MHPFIEFLLLLLLLLSAVVALALRDLLEAVVTLTLYSFLSALLFASLGAVDVAFTETVVGAGMVGVLFVVTVFRTSRRSGD